MRSRVLAALLTVGVAGLGAVSPAESATTPEIGLVGHGYGHGRGMGQYGALGYALGAGWNYHQILDHFYGGTTVGQAAAGSTMTVDMTNRDGMGTIVAQQNGRLAISNIAVGCTTGAPCAVRIDRIGAGTFKVFRGSACNGGSGGWTVIAASVGAASIAVTATAGATDNPANMLQLCGTDGIRWLRGDIWAVDTGTTQATVNHVGLDAYVRGVVPRESPAYWGTLGNGAGEQALLAQAVAARSYAMAAGFAPYAKTCDTTSCQVYGGRAFQDNAGTYTDLEGTPTYATSDSAVAATAGEVRVFSSGGGGPLGAIALTEFSSSTGGYTAGGTFPAVPDDGDATPSNPNHTWTDQASVSDIQSAFGIGRGPLQSIDITRRDGHGDLGGRVLGMTLHFSLGDVSTTGNGFAAALGLRSNWFSITSGIGGSGSPPPPPPSPRPHGYDALTADGTVYAFNGAAYHGSFAASATRTHAVGLGEVPGGYFILAADGTVHSFGAAVQRGSLAGIRLNAPPFQIAPTPSGDGYWIVAFDGGVFAYGGAHFWGSTGNRRLNRPIVGMAPTPTGRGYWLVAADGGIFNFGDAKFYGSTGNLHLNQPVVAIAASPSGRGYWMVAADGGVFNFGDAAYGGSLPSLGVRRQAVGLAGQSAGSYLIATADGFVYGFRTPAGGGPANMGARSSTVALALSF